MRAPGRVRNDAAKSQTAIAQHTCRAPFARLSPVRHTPDSSALRGLVIATETVRDIVSERAHRPPEHHSARRTSALLVSMCVMHRVKIIITFTESRAHAETTPAPLKPARARRARFLLAGHCDRDASTVWKRSVCIRAANTSTPSTHLQRKCRMP
jgi:hypothetical protein